MSQLIIYIISYSAAVLPIVLVSFLILLRHRAGQSKYFALFSLVIALWILFQFIAQLFYQHPSIAMFFLRCAFSLSSYLGLLFLNFAFSYTKKTLPSKLYWLIPVVISAFAFTDLVVKKAEISSSGIAVQEAGIVYIAQTLFIVISFIISLAVIFRHVLRKDIDSLERKRSLILLASVSQLVLADIIGAAVFAKVQLAQLIVPVSALIMVVSISYAVIKHKLFDIRFIVAKSFAYILLTASLAFIYGLILVESTNLLFGNSTISTVQQVIYIVVAVFLSFTAYPLKRYFDKISNRVFFRVNYEPQDVLDRFNNALVGQTNLDTLMNNVADVTLKTFSTRNIVMKVGDRDGVTYGEPRKALNSLCEDVDNIINQQKLRGVVNLDEVDALSSKQLYELKEKHSIVLLGILVGDGVVIGWLAFGEKLNGIPYLKQDIKLLEIAMDQSSIAIQNALRFKEIEDFNVTLQRKVEEATGELKRTNQKLVALDEAKDEFISMASHQLRTPLTSVKGYVSMVLEGDSGEISDQQRQLLNQAFVSSQRMVYLIADLLNVSRLKTGKFVIERGPTYLPDVVDGEIQQLQETAKARGLTLTFEKPKAFPMLNLDETKTRQVIMNFSDNAIYYTPSGGHIDIKLKDSPNYVEFTVVDNGIGVPKADQHKLFTKFYRANNAQKARPDGTGLGLFMAKKIISAQGGAIVFQSSENKGSTFGFRFPKSGELVAKPAEDSPVDSSAPQ